MRSLKPDELRQGGVLTSARRKCKYLQFFWENTEELSPYPQMESLDVPNVDGGCFL